MYPRPTDLRSDDTLDPATAAGTGEYQGERYFFCGAGCKRSFDAKPVQYA
jgi:YHS domain-containing protein